VLGLILDSKLHLREELEILFAKIVLKPALQLSSTKKRVETPKNVAAPIEVDSDPENDDFIQVQFERTFQEELLLEMSMNYVLETLMSLSSS